MNVRFKVNSSFRDERRAANPNPHPAEREARLEG
jgi:hypothetical protein